MKLKLMVLLLLVSARLQAQDSLSVINTVNDSNTLRGPIIYLDLGVGSSFSTIHGIQFFSSLNYQYKSHLFTARVTGIYHLASDYLLLAPLLALPTIRTVNTLEESGLLYGRRFISGGRSFSISAGISYNEWMKAFPAENGGYFKKHDYYAGLPFEMNVLWFKSEKRRYRIFGLIPVGKPTGIGSSIGFKLSGNVSRHGFVALGAVLGFGKHKEY